MGNLSSRNTTSPGSRKVILWDGTVEEFQEPITAAELMLDHPMQLVVEIQSDSTDGKIKPRTLLADQNLDPNKLYLMFPKHKRGSKPTHLSGADAQRLLLIANSALGLRPTSSRFLPLFLKVCAGPGVAAATVRNRNVSVKEGSGDMAGLEAGGRNGDAGRLVSKFELPDDPPEFLTRQLSGKGTWKPSLDTIVEKKMEKRVGVSHWFF